MSYIQDRSITIGTYVIHEINQINGVPQVLQKIRSSELIVFQDPFTKKEYCFNSDNLFKIASSQDINNWKLTVTNYGRGVRPEWLPIKSYAATSQRPDILLQKVSDYWTEMEGISEFENVATRARIQFKWGTGFFLVREAPPARVAELKVTLNADLLSAFANQINRLERTVERLEQELKTKSSQYNALAGNLIKGEGRIHELEQANVLNNKTIAKVQNTISVIGRPDIIVTEYENYNEKINKLHTDIASLGKTVGEIKEAQRFSHKERQLHVKSSNDNFGNIFKQLNAEGKTQPYVKVYAEPQKLESMWPPQETTAYVTVAAHEVPTKAQFVTTVMDHRREQMRALKSVEEKQSKINDNLYKWSQEHIKEIELLQKRVLLLEKDNINAHNKIASLSELVEKDRCASKSEYYSFKQAVSEAISNLSNICQNTAELHQLKQTVQLQQETISELDATLLKHMQYDHKELERKSEYAVNKGTLNYKLIETLQQKVDWNYKEVNDITKKIKRDVEILFSEGDKDSKRIGTLETKFAGLSQSVYNNHAYCVGHVTELKHNIEVLQSPK